MRALNMERGNVPRRRRGWIFHRRYSSIGIYRRWIRQPGDNRVQRTPVGVCRAFENPTWLLLAWRGSRIEMLSEI